MHIIPDIIHEFDLSVGGGISPSVNSALHAHGFGSIVSIGSNIAYIPAIVLSLRYRNYTIAVFTFVMAAISTVYHACQRNAFCILPHDTHHFLDLVTAMSMPAVAAVAHTAYANIFGSWFCALAICLSMMFNAAMLCLGDGVTVHEAQYMASALGVVGVMATAYATLRFVHKIPAEVLSGGMRDVNRLESERNVNGVIGSDGIITGSNDVRTYVVRYDAISRGKHTHWNTGIMMSDNRFGDAISHTIRHVRWYMFAAGLIFAARGIVFFFMENAASSLSAPFLHGMWHADGGIAIFLAYASVNPHVRIRFERS